jgi:hypothetical protein
MYFVRLFCFCFDFGSLSLSLSLSPCFGVLAVSWLRPTRSTYIHRENLLDTCRHHGCWWFSAARDSIPYHMIFMRYRLSSFLKWWSFLRAEPSRAEPREETGGRAAAAARDRRLTFVKRNMLTAARTPRAVQRARALAHTHTHTNTWLSYLWGPWALREEEEEEKKTEQDGPPMSTLHDLRRKRKRKRRKNLCTDDGLPKMERISVATLCVLYIRPLKKKFRATCRS